MIKKKFYVAMMLEMWMLTTCIRVTWGKLIWKCGFRVSSPPE